MAKYLAALDQGTTSSRAVLFTEDGQVVSSYNREFPQHYPKPGWVEHDPKDILDSQIVSLREAVRLADINPADIAAIGITNQRETTFLWDRNRRMRRKRDCLAMPENLRHRGRPGARRPWGDDPPEDRACSGRLFLRNEAEMDAGLL